VVDFSPARSRSRSRAAPRRAAPRRPVFSLEFHRPPREFYSRNFNSFFQLRWAFLIFCPCSRCRE